MTKYPKAKAYNIPSSEDFLSTFSKHLLEKSFTHNDIILLPTRRSCRKLERYLFANKKVGSLILPHLLTYSDLVSKTYAFLDSCPRLDIITPKTISKIDLYFLVWETLKKSHIDISHIDELLSFINKFYTFADSAEQIADSYIYNILHKLEEELRAKGLILEPTLRKIMSQRIIETFGESAQKIHMVLPVEIIPYTRNLLIHLAKFDNSSIYIQGIDNSISNEIWDIIGNSHPQWSIKNFLSTINLEKEKIINLGVQNSDKLISNLMYPNEFIYRWRELPKTNTAVHTIKCEDRYQEATFVSYIIREHLESGMQAIGIFSDDAFFNKLLKQKLLTWKIIANDTNETPIRDSPSANLFLLCTDLLLDQSPIKLLEVLKHPLSKFHGIDWYTFEVTYLRKPVVILDSLTEFPEISSWLDGLQQLDGSSFQEKLQQFINFINSFASLDEEFANELSDLQDVGLKSHITNREFVDLLKKLLNTKRMRNEDIAYDTVTITSFLEARLLKFDLVIIPQMNHPYPKLEVQKFFISPAQAVSIGIPQDEATIGYSNYDLSTHLTSKSFLTRAQKVDGKEEIPALIFEKAHTLLSLISHDTSHEKYFSWYHSQNNPQNIEPIARPLPQPKDRPKRLSVSAIEKLMENPYGFYANYVLGLKKLEPIDGNLSNREFGIATHETIKNTNFSEEVSQEKFIKTFMDQFRNESIQYLQTPEVQNFWLPRIHKIARWLWEYENDNAPNIKKIVKEHKSSYQLDDITVLAIPDRLEYRTDNTVKVVDYKTGFTPTIRDIGEGLYPQLPIEGLILANRGEAKEFAFEYHALKGKKESVEIKKVKADMTAVEEGLKNLIAKYLKSDEPFFAVCDESVLKKTRDYTHLSRVKEWFD